MRKLEQLGAKKVYHSKQRGTMIADWKRGPWEKIFIKSVGMIETYVTRTTEETRGVMEKVVAEI